MTVEEAFAMMEEAERAAGDSISYCEMDAETRKITVPETYKILGVESDEDIERVYFRGPRIVGAGIDLAAMGLRINYQNANGQKDSYPVDDLNVENELITFSWLLSRKAVAYKGTVKFIVCAVRMGDDGEISNEWNTTLASAEVLEGLEVDFSGIPDEEGKDLLESLIAQSQIKLMEVGEATAAANQSAERADAAAGSANNAAEEARKALEELKENIGIDDTAPSGTKTYSSQKIEEMAAVQMLSDSVLKNKLETKTADVKYKNGVLEITENAAKFSGAYVKNIPVTKNTDYYISFKSARTSNNGGGVVVYGSTLENSDDKIIIDKRNTLNYSGVFNTGEYEIIKITFYCSTPETEVPNTCTFWDIMLSEGENAVPYMENVRDIAKKVAGIDAEALDLTSRFSVIKAGSVLDVKKTGIYYTTTDVTDTPYMNSHGVLIVSTYYEDRFSYVYASKGYGLFLRFVSGSSDSGWVKCLTQNDCVNNLLGTDPKLPLASPQGKALDEKIEGVKSDVAEVSGNTTNLINRELFIPGDTTNAPPNNKFLNISLKERFNALNRCHYFRQSNGTEFEGCPPILKGKEFIGYREVYWYSTINVMVQLREFYPTPGRVWMNFYNNGTWTGWKSITPV